MTAQYTQPTTISTTEIEEIPIDFLAITRWRLPLQKAESRTVTYSPTFGVDWGIQKTQPSESRNYTKNLIINIATRAKPIAKAITQTKCNALITLPLEREPNGRLLYLRSADGATVSANGASINKGSNVNLIFDILGYRLDLLTVKFELINLLGVSMLTKEVDFQVFQYKPLLVDPVTKIQNWIGEIFLTPNDTLFVGTEAYLQLTYKLSIGNRTTRNYLLEQGKFNFK